MVGKSYTGEIRENSGHDYNISILDSINANQLGTTLHYASNFPTVYNLNNYNCADFGIAVGNPGGMNLPATTTSFGIFSGRSPGALGQDIRNMAPPANSSININTNGGNAPTKQGSCP